MVGSMPSRTSRSRSRATCSRRLTVPVGTFALTSELLQAPATDIEALQRLPVERLQSGQALLQLIDGLTGLELLLGATVVAGHAREHLPDPIRNRSPCG